MENTDTQTPKQDIVLRDKIGSQMFAEIQQMSAYEAVEHIKRCSQ